MESAKGVPRPRPRRVTPRPNQGAPAGPLTRLSISIARIITNAYGVHGGIGGNLISQKASVGRRTHGTPTVGPDYLAGALLITLEALRNQ